MPVLHLMVGLPCSGKTTAAKQLEKEYHALLLTPDVWHLQLFGHDMESRDHDRNHDMVEKIMWDVASQVLALGVDVILDFGCWSREERDAFRKKATDLGAGFQIHYMDVSNDKILRRLEERNRLAPDEIFVIPVTEMQKYMAVFEPPVPDELC